MVLKENKWQGSNRVQNPSSLGPLVLTAIEREIGMKKMQLWLQLLAEADAEFSDYDLLKQTLQQVVKNKAVFQGLLQKYLETEKARENAIRKIKES